MMMNWISRDFWKAYFFWLLISSWSPAPQDPLLSTFCAFGACNISSVVLYLNHIFFYQSCSYSKQRKKNLQMLILRKPWGKSHQLDRAISRLNWNLCIEASLSFGMCSWERCFVILIAKATMIEVAGLTERDQRRVWHVQWKSEARNYHFCWCKCFLYFPTSLIHSSTHYTY